MILKPIPDIPDISGPGTQGTGPQEFALGPQSLGSVQVLYKQGFLNSGPPLDKQNKHGLRPPPLKCLYKTWMAIHSNMRNI